MAFETRNPDYAARTFDSFNRQTFMHSIGAVIEKIGPGKVTVRLPARDDLFQQHGFFHGGLVGTIADNAGGYAGFTLLRPEDSILSVEYKLNIVAPAVGDEIIEIGEVVRPGRTLTVCQSEVYAVTGETRKLCAVMLGTFMAMANSPDHPHDASEKGA